MNLTQLNYSDLTVKTPRYIPQVRAHIAARRDKMVTLYTADLSARCFRQGEILELEIFSHRMSPVTLWAKVNRADGSTASVHAWPIALPLPVYKKRGITISARLTDVISSGGEG